MAEIAHRFDEGGWGMYPILWCSIVLLAIGIERAIYHRWPRADSGELIEAMRPHVRVGDLASALAIAVTSSGATARIARVALKSSLLPVPVLDQAIEAHVAAEIAPHRRRLPALVTIGGIAMLCGLLGTCTGLVRPFGCVANADAASRATMLARGMSEAMNCTAFGLLVSTLAIGVAALLRHEADAITADLTATGQSIRNMLVDHRERLRWNGMRAPTERATYRS